MSGGAYLSFADAKSFDADLTRIANWMHNGYALSFIPTDKTAGLHTLKVRVDVAGARIEARASYWIAQ